MRALVQSWAECGSISVMVKRYWQNWDEGVAARQIDDFWLGAEGEIASREALARHAAEFFGLRAPIFEVGCGTGLMAQALLDGGVADPYSGGDVSEKMLEIARERHPRLSFETVDVFNLVGSRENVVCFHVLQHLPHYREALAQLLSFGRRLLIATWLTDAEEDRIETREEFGQIFHNNTYARAPFLQACAAGGGRVREYLLHSDGAAITIEAP